MKYYFSGIGGIGMSALALYKYYKEGKESVYGSNSEYNERVEYLLKKGINVKLTQDSFLPDVDLLIRSTAVKDNNPEIIEARKRKIKVIQRMELLNEILKNNLSIGVTGTDGKTTTTAMLSQIFKNSGKNPTVFLGGMHDSLEDGNFRIGKGIIIAEVDESDGFIKDSQTDFSIVNNLRADHLEHYKSEFKNLEYSLLEFVNKTKELVLLNKDDFYLSKWNLQDKKVLYFGQDNDADFILKNRRQDSTFQEFEIYRKNTYIGTIILKLPGLHYAYDALASTSLALEYGIDFNIIKESFLNYRSVERRFNILFNRKDICIIDDYAHTPDEIEATIKAAREYFPDKKILTIFQPHRFTRLYYHFKDFVEVLKNSDEVFVYRIYSAFEEPIQGVDERKIADVLESKGVSSKFYHSENLILEELLKEKNTILLFVGAGDITEVAKKLTKTIEKINQ